MTNHRNSERGSIEVFAFIAFIVLGALGFGGYAIAWNNARQTVTCVVDSKQATSNKDGGNKYLLFTKNCGQLQVADSMMNGQFNSTDTYAGIKEGHSYTFETVGWRNGFFSTYPNVVKANE